VDPRDGLDNFQRQQNMFVTEFLNFSPIITLSLHSILLPPLELPTSRPQPPKVGTSCTWVVTDRIGSDIAYGVRAVAQAVVIGVSPHRNHQSSPEHFMKYVTDIEAPEQGFLLQLWFSLSASFHQCCTIFSSFITNTIWPYQLRVSLNNTQNTSQTCPSNLTVLCFIKLALFSNREILYVFEKYPMSSCHIRKILVPAFVSSIFITIISQFENRREVCIATRPGHSNRGDVVQFLVRKTNIFSSSTKSPERLLPNGYQGSFRGVKAAGV
jgi:hypothetical protein